MPFSPRPASGNSLPEQDSDQGFCRPVVGALFYLMDREGRPPRLVEAAIRMMVPYLPGVATASEAMALAEEGLSHLKFFPAEAIGGTKHLASLASPLPNIKFCPTGGITQENAASWLSLPNVVCVGGSWVAPVDAIRARDRKRIITLAREAAALKR
jgi:2-dehydro-3-deoxyphosphogluconate aldolase/(4S)-4-hydroxy-2-oxoglutarate aldolase